MKNYRKVFILMMIIGSLVSTRLLSQERKTAMLDPDAWEIDAARHEFTNYRGQDALYLENGTARLIGSSFKTGIIDYDVNFREGRKFIGVHFRIKDKRNYEEFYLRAHQSGNPDAMQYTPVFNGVAGWQLYYGEGYSTAHKYNFTEWTHIRLIVAEDRMDVFIDDMSRPVLHVHDLKAEPIAGSYGFGTQLGGAYYANLEVKPLSEPALVSEVTPLPEPEPGTILKWQVSSVFNVNEVVELTDLNDLPNLNSLEWLTLSAEYTGTVNLASVSNWSEDNNTVLVKAVIHSDKDQLKRMGFGYSDVAQLFVNGKPLYLGQRVFRSRDYRYLGTIGYYDVVYIDLKQGENEVVFAVSEMFGGWGL
jgi:hypothetical protein